MTFPSEEQLADEVGEFAESIAPAKERWLYCLDRSTYTYVCADGRELSPLADSAMPVCDRIVGCYRGSAKSRLAKIQTVGWDAAQEWAAGMTRQATRTYFYVGPMQPWNVGHVYFARIRTHPHVVKIGFSRRVRDRLDDIQSKTKSGLMIAEVGLEVGTLLDEHKWHRTQAANRITGEWFFDPSMADRTLPDFLQPSEEKAA